MKKILVVIDMQNDFIDGPLGTPEARAIVPKVCEKIRDGEWSVIHVTMDTHDGQYLETQEGKKLPVEHCIRYTDGWKLNRKLETALRNSIDIYTNGSDGIKIGTKETFGAVGLAERIENDLNYRNMDQYEIHIVGVCTDICVISNALILKSYYPDMKIVVDASCCAGTTPEMHQKALDVMRSCQIDIINAVED